MSMRVFAHDSRVTCVRLIFETLDIRWLRKFYLQKNGENKNSCINKYHLEKLAKNLQKIGQ
jgi:hypothetical protein